MLQIIFALLICFTLGFFLWFTGQVIIKQLKVYEENKMLNFLLSISIGISLYLITTNLFGCILKDFNIGGITSTILISAILIWKRNDLKEVCMNLKKYTNKDNLLIFFKGSTDKYFWILLATINLIYGLTAFTSTKLDHSGQGNTHIFNINQLINNIYPPKLSSLPNIDLKYHYGADILSALISKLSRVHPEISLDLLTILFLNLSFLTIYSLSVKFLNTNRVNKYLIPFIAFLGWGPVTSLFKKNSVDEVIPGKLLEKIQYLTQSRLLDSANWSGTVFHWFFSPSIGFGTFFFLIALYLIYRFIEKPEQSIGFICLLGIFLSSFVIIDFSKLIILLGGTITYIALTYNPIPLDDSKNKITTFESKVFLRNFGIILLIVFIFGFIHGNYLILNNVYVSLFEFYKFGKSNIDNKFSPLSCNTILLAVFIFGFYKAYKEKQNWVRFLIPYFAFTMIIPYFITIPNAGSGRIFMAGNILGAFSFPLVIDFIKNRLKITDKKLTIFYIFVFTIFVFSTIMFFFFGDKDKPNFTYNGQTLKYTGIQQLQMTAVADNSEKIPFSAYLKSKGSRNQKILIEREYAQNISNYSGLGTFVPSQNIVDDIIKKTFTENLESGYTKSFSLDKKFFVDNKINWIYLTPKMFRFFLPPQAKMRLLNVYLNKGVISTQSNKKSPGELIELLQINPSSLSEGCWGKTVNNQDSTYIKQIADCPYFGIYNAMSNDFDGDKISDIAFYDQLGKKWHIVYGKNQEESEIDLASNLLSNFTASDLFIPIPSDYDGDGKTDIALFNKSLSTWNVLYSSNSMVDNKRGCIGTDEIVLPCDLDGDSKTDISCYGFDSNNWPALLSSSNWGYKSLSPNDKPTLLDINITSDIDGDKKSDYISFNPVQATFYIYLSTKNYNPPAIIKSGEITSRVIIEDFDGDKNFDISTWTPETGNWEIILAKDILANYRPDNSIQLVGCGITNTINPDLNPLKCSSYTVMIGSNSDIPMPGDYNGDGKAEIAIYHPDKAELEIVYGQNNKKIDLSKYRGLIPASFIGI